VLLIELLGRNGFKTSPSGPISVLDRGIQYSKY
jgi:hypothetical protein